VLIPSLTPHCILCSAKYCIAFDPLDGSSNIDCNVSTGTIFAIYQRDELCKGGFQDILQPGNKLVAAGYCMYGSSTQLVLTWGKGVHGFTLDPTIGTFILSHQNIRIPDDPKTVRAVSERLIHCQWWETDRGDDGSADLLVQRRQLRALGRTHTRVRGRVQEQAAQAVSAVPSLDLGSIATKTLT
jgi:hypothetical protein